MTPLRTAALAAVLALTTPLFAADAPKADDTVFKQLTGDASARTPNLESAYAKVVPPLLAKPEADDSQLQKLSFHASRPGAEPERAALSKVLAANLASASKPAKILLLRHIQRIGREETVPTVAALLGDADAQLRECARRALTNNPTSAAADALRTAFASADDPTWKAALLNAVAYRRDVADAPLFAKAAASTDEAVRIPALMALARTGDAHAAPTISAARDSGSQAAREAAHDAYLVLADRLVTLDDRPAAAAIYRQYLAAPQRHRTAAIIGLGVVGSPTDLAGLLSLFTDKDPQARGAALQALARRHDPDVADQIAVRLPAADAATKPWLLRALLAMNDPRAKQAYLAAATDPDASVRAQAITGLAQFGEASAVPLLLQSAATKGEEQVAARNALEVLPGAAVDDALLARLADGPVPQRTEVIRALGARHTQAAVDRLFPATSDPDSGIRSESWKSLALIAEPDVIPRALQVFLEAKEDADRSNAAKAIVALARKSDDADARVAPLLVQVDRAQGPAKSALLNAIGQLGGDKALAAVRTAAKDSDEKTHEAGVRALAAWPDAAPLPDLLALAKEEKNETLAILSLRGYVRLVGLQSKRTAPETVKLYEDALAVARRPDEKKAVLGGLGEVKDPTALHAVAPYLADEALVNEACAAAVKIAKETWENNRDLAKSTLTKVLEVSKNDGQKKSAKETLDKIAAPPQKK